MLNKLKNKNQIRAKRKPNVIVACPVVGTSILCVWLLLLAFFIIKETNK